MKVGIMQPYFFPYLGYWQLLAAVDQYVIYDDVTFIKNGWINRNNILLNGAAHMFTIPLEGASSYALIKDVKITSQEKPLKKLLKTLEQAYQKAPYYKDVYPIVEDVISGAGTSISSALIRQFERVKAYLGLETELIVSSTLSKDNSLHAQDKVLHICKLLNATEYYNAIGGTELYSKEAFSAQNITLRFLKMKPCAYTQFKNEFVPNLSMMDVLMFNSPDEVRKLLTMFELV